MVDWKGIERSEEFRELVKRRRSFVVPATIFFLAYYMAFIIVAGYAPDFMAESVYRGADRRLLLRADAVPDGLRARHLVPAQGRPRVRPALGRGRRGGDRRRGDRALRARRAARRRSRDDAHREGQRRSAGDGGDHPLDHARHHLLGLQARDAAPSASTPRAARSPARQNGLAISGDYLSAASFLGIAGLIYLYGFDGFLYSIGFLVAFLTVMFLLAERMRNAGKYTIADVLSFRLNETPARAAAALGTFAVVTFYLIAQMVGAGVLIQKLVGIDFSMRGDPHRHRSCSVTWSSAAWSPRRGCRSSRPCC